jgi:putative Mg2+ transporter-C (MgtC) family protein
MDWAAEFINTEIGHGTILLRLISALVLGGIIGLDREYLARPAGLRTHILVAVAATTFTLIAVELVLREELKSGGGSLSLDPTRVVEAVTAGVAFLAAGTIIQARGHVHGLTTGASLWLAGAIGAACGIGAIGVAAMVALLGVVVLTLLRLVERKLPKTDDPPRE